MIRLTATETSVLSLIASSRGLSAVEYEKLFNELSPAAQEIAVALSLLKHQKTSTELEPSEDAKKTARALLAVA